MAVKHVVTRGFGFADGTKFLPTRGYSIGAAIAVNSRALTLRARSAAMTLLDRSADLTLRVRTAALTLWNRT